MLLEQCTGKRALSELDLSSIQYSLKERLGPSSHKLDQYAPESLTLGAGRRVRVEYEPGLDPAISSRLQDFFGTSQGPRVLGRVPIVLHLLAPNQRDVQVTTDLAGFWDRHYPAIRKELMRKYPRHSWPEDPRTALPPEPKPRR